MSKTAVAASAIESESVGDDDWGARSVVRVHRLWAVLVIESKTRTRVRRMSCERPFGWRCGGSGRSQRDNESGKPGRCDPIYSHGSDCAAGPPLGVPGVEMEPVRGWRLLGGVSGRPQWIPEVNRVQREDEEKTRECEAKPEGYLRETRQTGIS